LSPRLPEIPTRQILAETAQRNTAPRLGWPRIYAVRLYKDSVMKRPFPADHIISHSEPLLAFSSGPPSGQAEEGKIA